MVVSIDQLDSALLAMLSRDARAGVVELASALGVTRHTVQARLQRLEALDVLRGYVPAIDLAAVGVSVEGYVALALQQGKLDDVVQRLTRIPQVLEVHAITGREDLLVRVATTDHADLQSLIQHIVAMPGVSHSNTSLALTTPLHYRIQPLLEHITRASGWGRATPLATAGSPRPASDGDLAQHRPPPGQT
ncbi:Lrp/AsnC family transcriptional regulator [Pedococcus sp. P5_B7]